MKLYRITLRLCAMAIAGVGATAAFAQWDIEPELSETMMSVLGHDASLLDYYAGHQEYQSYNVQLRFDMLGRSATYTTASDATYMGKQLNIFSETSFDPERLVYSWSSRVVLGSDAYLMEGEVEYEILRDKNKKKKVKIKGEEGEISNEDIVEDPVTKKMISRGTFVKKTADGGTVEIPVKDDYEGGGEGKGNWAYDAAPGHAGVRDSFAWDTDSGVGWGLVEVGGAVPEPTSVMGVGVGVLALLRRRKRG